MSVVCGRETAFTALTLDVEEYDSTVPLYNDRRAAKSDIMACFTPHRLKPTERENSTWQKVLLDRLRRSGLAPGIWQNQTYEESHVFHKLCLLQRAGRFARKLPETVWLTVFTFAL